ncbi:hypothetical protein TRFO_20588 [Tritrichomonas foetus]|uniref:Myb-like DNA-binding domain containing protein n=1 Tax=Tritrichomonas foetus TaxID=1144522 RepID=A0A1J4KK29_9EUKA|nr:hypothetical protein TRFO_20588 [Tritrichomonas foetus]|eukprot:OHT10204.1 hypothetical protein TRFO_20588 [Tritrichomonas foetus]
MRRNKNDDDDDYLVAVQKEKLARRRKAYKSASSHNSSKLKNNRPSKVPYSESSGNLLKSNSRRFVLNLSPEMSAHIMSSIPPNNVPNNIPNNISNNISNRSSSNSTHSRSSTSPNSNNMANGSNNLQRKRRRLFTCQEDKLLISLVERHGVNSWIKIAEMIPGRTSRQCKERYNTYLSPDVNNSPWSESEDELLLAKVIEIGKKWAEISRCFNGRTANSVKNRYHLHLRGHVQETNQTKKLLELSIPNEKENIDHLTNHKNGNQFFQLNDQKNIIDTNSIMDDNSIMNPNSLLNPNKIMEANSVMNPTQYYALLTNQSNALQAYEYVNLRDAILNPGFPNKQIQSTPLMQEIILPELNQIEAILINEKNHFVMKSPSTSPQALPQMIYTSGITINSEPKRCKGAEIYQIENLLVKPSKTISFPRIERPSSHIPFPI